jgi:hypothetical protein
MRSAAPSNPGRCPSWPSLIAIVEMQDMGVGGQDSLPNSEGVEGKFRIMGCVRGVDGESGSDEAGRGDAVAAGVEFTEDVAAMMNIG